MHETARRELLNFQHGLLQRLVETTTWRLVAGQLRRRFHAVSEDVLLDLQRTMRSRRHEHLRAIHDWVLYSVVVRVQPRVGRFLVLGGSVEANSVPRRRLSEPAHCAASPCRGTPACRLRRLVFDDLDTLEPDLCCQCLIFAFLGSVHLAFCILSPSLLPHFLFPSPLDSRKLKLVG